MGVALGPVLLVGSVARELVAIAAPQILLARAKNSHCGSNDLHKLSASAPREIG